MNKDYPSLPSYQKSPRMRRGQRITLDNGGLTGGTNRPIRRQNRGGYENEAQFENEDEDGIVNGYKPSHNRDGYRRNGHRNNRQVRKFSYFIFCKLKNGCHYYHSRGILGNMLLSTMPPYSGINHHILYCKKNVGNVHHNFPFRH